MARNFLLDLGAKRQKYLEGLDANEGDINLDIFEDFYPDRAHFVFEILQNAEDAEATEVSFQLSPKGCLIEHDGKRLFNEKDIRSITGIHNSTKRNREDQIGRWGIGFKSVFAYTISPEIQSGVFSFRIVRLVKPEAIDRVDLANNKTRIWLPFNHPMKSSDDAYKEVEGGLRELAEATLLFLNQLQSISWKIGDSEAGSVLRVLHTEKHIEVLKEANGTKTASSHFLRFMRPVEGLAVETQHKVAVAFALDFLPEVEGFDPKVSLAKQMKISPVPGKVSVFFPAEKETSGLRFHLHAPFVTELSRASIKDALENEPLFEQLAALCAASMHDVKEHGLLRRDFLAVLPNPQDPIGKRYSQIRDEVISVFNEEPLMPTFGGGHSPARNLYQAKASLKDLLSTKDIEFLIPYKEIPPQWATNRELQGTNAERFMSAIAIRDWDVDDFLGALTENADEDWQEPDKDFMAWLSAKPAEWFQRMYAMLSREPEAEDELHQLLSTRIVRLRDGSFSTGDKCYFPDEQRKYIDIVPCVDHEVLEVGNSKIRKKSAHKFLEEMGVREIGEPQLVEAILESEYKCADRRFKEKSYLSHLNRFLKLVHDDSSSVTIFSNFKIFLGQDNLWHTASEIYIDHPYTDTGMSEYFEIVGLPKGTAALAEAYKKFPIDTNRVLSFAKLMGAYHHIPLVRVSCYQNPNWFDLYRSTGNRVTDELDQDYKIDKFDRLVSKRSHRISRLIWISVLEGSKTNPRVLRAIYRKNAKHGSRYVGSQLVHQLSNAEWISQGDRFAKPCAARAELLPDGFTFDPGWAWIKSIEFGKEVELESEKAKAAAANAAEMRNRRDAAAAELGIKTVDLKLLDKFRNVPLEQVESFLQEWEKYQKPVELPDHEPRNPVRREERVGGLAKDASGRKTEERTRSISIGREEVKAEAGQYLQQQYMIDSEIICQVCKKPMPFRLDDDSVYFEKVEFISELKRRHHQNYLSLCPNHAAMFRHANSTKEFMLEMFTELTGNELEVVLAQQNTSIYFTKIHIADLKKVIEVDSENTQLSERVDTEPS